MSKEKARTSSVAGENPAQNCDIYFEDSFENQTGVRAYLGNVAKGYSEVEEIPTFAKGISTDDLISEWMDTLKSIRTEWPSLWDYENDLANKVGPLSVMKPIAERLDDIRSYYEGILLPSEPVMDSAIRATCHEFVSLRGLTLRSQARTMELMRKSTNSGSPFFTKRRRVVGETMPALITTVEDKVFQIIGSKAKTYGAPAVVGWRGQEGGRDPSDVKQRVVWMFPFAVNLRELQLYQPLIEGAQKLNLIPAWVSMDAVDQRITRMFDTKSDDDLIVCTDFSKFDQHFNHWMQMCAKSILTYVASGAAARVWFQDVFGVKYMIPLVYAPNRCMIGAHGMGSGSGGTNVDETLAHRSLQYEAAIVRGAFLNPNSQCLGDDGILTYPGITVEDVVDAYTKHGLEMNDSKQYASKVDCTYLRRWHHKQYRIAGVCVGVYSTARALGRLRYVERPLNELTGTDNAIVLRELSILENCKYHPMKEQFLDYCIKRDKLKLGLAVPGLLDNIETVAQELIDQMPDFLGYTRNLQAKGDPTGGISTWWSYNYVKSKA